MDNTTYYSTNYILLNKSKLTPPNYLFGVVWTILYAMMGVSFVLVFNKCKRHMCLPIVIFLVHLFFNFIWSYLFINYNDKRIALADILVVLGMAIYLFKEFRKYSVLASNLLVPYIIWLSFATYLCVYIVLNN